MLTFSDEVAMTTFVQPSSAKSPSPKSPPSGSLPVQAVSASAAIRISAPAVAARADLGRGSWGEDGSTVTFVRARRGGMGTA